MNVCMFTHGYSHPLDLVQTSSWEPYLENRKGQVWQLLLPDLEGRTVLSVNDLCVRWKMEVLGTSCLPSWPGPEKSVR